MSFDVKKVCIYSMNINHLQKKLHNFWPFFIYVIWFETIPEIFCDIFKLEL